MAYDFNAGGVNGSRIDRTQQPLPSNEALRAKAAGISFETMLQEQLDKNSPLQFSKHAKERIDQRGIEVSKTLLDSIEGAVSKARSKGARDVVVIGATGAFIVNVPNNMVITTIAGSEMKDNIFTNIDSAVLI